MNGRIQKALMAGAILAAAATTFGARAADQSDWFACERTVTEGSYSDCQAYLNPNQATANEAQRVSVNIVAAAPASAESPEFERFEHQLSAGSVDIVTPSERDASAQ